MTKKVNITIVAIIVIISLAISIYIPNKDRLSGKKEDTSKNYQTIEENGKVGISPIGFNVFCNLFAYPLAFK